MKKPKTDSERNNPNKNNSTKKYSEINIEGLGRDNSLNRKPNFLDDDSANKDELYIPFEMISSAKLRLLHLLDEYSSLPDDETVECIILSMLLTGLTPDELIKFVEFIDDKVPKELDSDDKKLTVVNNLFEKLILVEKDGRQHIFAPTDL